MCEYNDMILWIEDADIDSTMLGNGHKTFVHDEARGFYLSMS